jgi:hypothetical protein
MDGGLSGECVRVFYLQLVLNSFYFLLHGIEEQITI